MVNDLLQQAIAGATITLSADEAACAFTTLAEMVSWGITFGLQVAELTSAGETTYTISKLN